MKKPALSWAGLLLIPFIEFLIKETRVQDGFNEGDDGRDKGPTENQEEDSLNPFAEIKLVNAEAAQKQGQ